VAFSIRTRGVRKFGTRQRIVINLGDHVRGCLEKL
jgi:hypothetical protein